MSSEVGSGQVAIFPTFRGFRRAVTREVDGTAAEAGRGFSRRLGRSGTTAGQATGRVFRAAFQREAAGASEDVLRAINSDVAKSARALSAARLKEQDAAGRVRAAEAALTEARARGGAESARAIAAEERLFSAQRSLAAAQDVTRVSSDALAAAQARLAAASQVAAVAATRTRSNFRQMFSDFRSGFVDARAAQSNFTGLAGSLGGVFRLAVSPIETAMNVMRASVALGVRLALIPIRRFAPTVRNLLSLASTPFAQFAAGFRDAELGATGFIGALGRLGALSRTVFNGITGGVRSASSRLARMGQVVLDQVTRPFAQLRAGFRDAQLGATGFIGIMGRVGALSRRGLTVAQTGFDRVATVATRAFTTVQGVATRAFRAIGSVIPEPVRSAGLTIAAAFRDVGRTALSGLGVIGGAAGVAGSALRSAFSSAFAGVRRLAADAADTVGTVFKGASVVIATTVGAALVGGFNRLSAIENAQAKLRGLGNTTEDVASIMASANKSVSGTMFSLADAATISATAVAAGVKPGEDLDVYLQAIVSSAAAAGVGLSEMGSIVNKVQTGGRAYTTEIQQIADRGLPIFTKLAERYGVSQEALREMVAEGKVDSATFVSVLQDMSGGVASEMGKTTTGTFANMTASLNRFGAALLQGLFPILAPLFTTITAGFDAASKAVTPFVTVISTAIAARVLPVLETLQAVFRNFKESFSFQFDLSAFSGLGTVFAVLAPVIGLVVSNISGLLARLPLIGGLMPAISGPLGIVLGIVAALLALSPGLREALGSAFETIIPIVGQLLATLAPVISQVVSALVPALAAIGDALGTAITAVLPLFEPLVAIIAALAPLLPPIAALVGQVAAALAGSLADAVVLLMPILTQVATLLAGVVGQAVATLVPVIMALIPIIVQIATTLGGVLGTVLTALAPVFSMFLGLIAQLVPVLMPIITAVLGLIAPLLQLIAPLLQLVAGILPPLIGLFISILQPVLALAVTIVTALVPVIQGLVTILSGVITFLTGVFTGNWSMAFEGIKQIFQGIWDTITSAITGIIDIVGAIPGTIIDVFKGAGESLFQSGKDLVGSFIDGLKDMLGSVGDVASDIISAVTDFFPHSPAKKGPLSGAGWRQIGNSSRAIVDEFNSGFDTNRVDLSKSLNVAASGVGAGATAGTAARDAGGRNVEFNVYAQDGMSAEAVGRAAEAQLNFRMKTDR